ncbi:MAG TPA: hypothetical protein VF988_01840 [Verrucomicrobiae bacterium]
MSNPVRALECDTQQIHKPFAPLASMKSDRIFSALTVEYSENRGRIISFSIPEGKEADSGLELLACLADGFEVWLNNDLDEGDEGCAIFKRSASGFVTMIGGHGWSGKWEPIDQEGVLSAVFELAKFNRGGHWSTQGSLR